MTELEQRVETLEREVADLKSRVVGRRQGDWRRTVGMFRGDSVFREVVEEGRRLRQAEPTEDWLTP